MCFVTYALSEFIVVFVNKYFDVSIDYFEKREKTKPKHKKEFQRNENKKPIHLKIWHLIDWNYFQNGKVIYRQLKDY